MFFVLITLSWCQQWGLVSGDLINLFHVYLISVKRTCGSQTHWWTYFKRTGSGSRNFSSFCSPLCIPTSGTYQFISYTLWQGRIRRGGGKGASVPPSLRIFWGYFASPFSSALFPNPQFPCIFIGQHQKEWSLKLK